MTGFGEILPSHNSGTLPCLGESVVGKNKDELCGEGEVQKQTLGRQTTAIERVVQQDLV